MDDIGHTLNLSQNNTKKRKCKFHLFFPGYTSYNARFIKLTFRIILRVTIVSSDELTVKMTSKHFLLFLIGVMSQAYITTAKYHLDLLYNGGCSITFTNELYAVKKTGSFYKRSPPTEESESWIKCAEKIGNNGWDSFKFLFLGPDGDLYAVRKKNGEFLKGSPPENAGDTWSARATIIGNNGWADFKFLFFGPGGDLYAVRKKNGEFLKGSPPKNAGDSWSATIIGNNGWADFKFLFFGPHCNLYAVKQDGSIVTTYEPKDNSDAWLGRAKKIGARGWEQFKFLFFGPGGYLYAVPCDGSLRKAPPPTNANETWVSHSTKIGAKGWETFVFLF
ncbi:tachylectin-2-like isoform X1 [Xenia sp. Carnegie-2017]|uniref:tachylectin-2-like isoform X1 n=2 Tax=Xenia sp. Carnegie-2017 TaxID=2897299 RepID=UPI001F03F57F|nr:tachylectin-2-like isoform X1 [Xenia sp. Carnegie-2017]